MLAPVKPWIRWGRPNEKGCELDVVNQMKKVMNAVLDFTGEHSSTVQPHQQVEDKIEPYIQAKRVRQAQIEDENTCFLIDDEK